MGHTAYQILPFLTPTSFYVCVLAVGQYGHKNFNRDDLACLPVSNLQLLSCKIDIQLMARLMLKLHGSFLPGILPMIMFHKLGVTVRLLSLLAILLIMVQKRKSRMVPLLIHLFKVKHQLIEAGVLYGGVRWKK